MQWNEIKMKLSLKTMQHEELLDQEYLAWSIKYDFFEELVLVLNIPKNTSHLMG